MKTYIMTISGDGVLEDRTIKINEDQKKLWDYLNDELGIENYMLGDDIQFDITIECENLVDLT